MAHFTCVGATVAQLRGTLDEMAQAGIENVLALRGDPPAGEETWRKTEGGLEYSSELVALVKADYPFAIGAACFPETHIHAISPQADLEYLAEKVRAGVDFLITQLFFDNALYFDFVDARAGHRDRGADHPRDHADHPRRPDRADGAMCGASIPDGLRRELHAREQAPEAVLDFGVAYATLQCAELLAPGAPGIHFYTLNRSPATRAILCALKLARPWQRAEAGGPPVPRRGRSARRPNRGALASSISRPSATREEPSGACSARRPSRSGGRCPRPTRPAASASR